MAKYVVKCSQIRFQAAPRTARIVSSFETKVEAESEEDAREKAADQISEYLDLKDGDEIEITSVSLS